MLGYMKEKTITRISGFLSKKHYTPDKIEAIICILFLKLYITQHKSKPDNFDWHLASINDFIGQNKNEFDTYGIKICLDLPKEDIKELLNIFNDLYRLVSENGSSDMLGEVYEVLLQKLTTIKHDSLAEFFTPLEVACLIAAIAAPQSGMSVYDPSSGFGRLLISAFENQNTLYNISFHCQEINPTLLNITRMNFLLNEITNYKLTEGDTLLNPYLNSEGKLPKYDRVVGNPPFSLEYWGQNIQFTERFPYGFDSMNSSVSHLLFFQHMLASLKDDGKLVVIMPLEFLFKEDVQKYIRKQLVTEGIIEAIIKLPPLLFTNTRISACIVVANKLDASLRKQILFIDAKDMYKPYEGENKLTSGQITQIHEIYNANLEIEGISKVVNVNQIKMKRYNLNPTQYVENNSEPIDIKAFIFDIGIPKKEVHEADKLFARLNLPCSYFFENKSLDYYGFRPNIENKEDIRSIVNHPEIISTKKALKYTLESWRRNFRRQISFNSNIKNLESDLIQSFLPVLLPFHIFEIYELKGIIADSCEELFELSYNTQLQFEDLIGEFKEKSIRFKESDILVKKRELNKTLQVEFYNVLENTVIKEYGNKIGKVIRFIEDLWDKYHDNLETLEDDRDITTQNLFRELKE